jgi:hypothetical protein
LTDGVDSNSFLYHSTLRALAARSDAILHVMAFPERWAPFHFGAIAFRADGRAAVGVDQYFWMLQQASAVTGGAFHTLRADGDFVALVNQALGELRKRYLLRYTPEGVDQEGWHTIEVKVTRRGRYDVQARRGYQWRDRQ